MSNIISTTVIERLRHAVEQKAGQKIQTPKDFDYLRDCIFSERHDMISTSTLKRIWGYVASDGQPRIASLDLLARYVGYNDWENFAEQHKDDGAPSADEPLLTAARPRRHMALRALVVVVAALMAVAAVWLLATKDSAPTTSSPKSGLRMLHKGEDFFRSTDQYLSLFGIEDSDTAYFQPLPGLEHVYVWGPEYHNPVWHNDGDSLLLLPTITEYWHPLQGTAEYQSEKYINEVNAKLYYERLVKDELRITFMRDLVEGFYVFLGVYRMDHELSTTEKCVWRRVADSIDLGALPDVALLREKLR